MAESSYRDIDQRIEDVLRPRSAMGSATGAAGAAAGTRTGTDAQVDTTLIVGRIGRLEAEISELRGTLARLEPKLDKAAGLADTSAANLVTAADLAASEGRIREKLAEKPGFAYLWLALAVLVGAVVASFATGVAVLHIVR
jgi:hypothetical protein